MSEKTALELNSLRQKRLHFLRKKVFRAQRDFKLIEDGDRILVGVSGGKDSITLCHVLALWRDTALPKFQFEAIHAQPEGYEINRKNRKILAEHLERIKVPVHFVTMNFSEFSTDDTTGYTCYRCAWKRRKELFVFAAENGFSKVAFGHHLDDAAETTLMNLLYHANLGTMEPKISFFDGKVSVIRPMILAEEKEIVRVSKTLDFEFFGCQCPGEIDSQRTAMKEYIRSFGKLSKMIKRNLWKASATWSEKVESSNR